MGDHGLRHAPAVDRAKLERATMEFAKRLAQAVLAGTEHDKDMALVPEPGTERPMLARAVTLVPDGPAIPQKPRHNWDASNARRREFAEELRERMRANVRPPLGKLTVLDLAGNTCRFPYGEGAAIRFCGAPPVVDGCPYCRQHARKCLSGLRARFEFRKAG